MPGFPDLSDPLYRELHRLAARHLRLRPNESLQPTLLVNEAYLRLAEQGQTWQSRTDFYKAAARVMRFALVDHIRAKMAEKRGGGVDKVALDVTLPDYKAPLPATDVMALHQALDDMAAEHPEHVQVVILRYFGGMSVPEVAEALDMSVVMVERRWRFARAWLRTRISQE